MFNQYEIGDEVVKALADMGYSQPTEVQEQTIEKILAGKDLIVNAKTGSGKTAAFGVPLIEKISKGEKNPRALVMTPTRELAIQVAKELSAIGKYKKLKSYTVYGQHNIDVEIGELKKGVDLIIGTPGRLLDHLKRGTLNPQAIKYVVLDEADRMLDMGFIDQVSDILKQLPKQRDTYLFSATMPFEVRSIAWEYMQEPDTVEISSDTMTVDLIEQQYIRSERHKKRVYLDRFLAIEKPNACIVFCNTRRCVDMVVDFLKQNKYSVEALHGAISQARRTKTIERFKKAQFHILVATDVAARGLHIDNLDLVINYDVPLDNDNYVHRVGRTGRAGNGGKAISLVTGEDLMTLYEIEEHIGVLIKEVDPPSYAAAHHQKKPKGGKKQTQQNKANTEASWPKFEEEKLLKTKVLRGSARKDSSSHQEIKVDTSKSKLNDTVTKTVLEQNDSNKMSAAKTAEIIANYKNKPVKQSFWQKLKAKLFK